MSYVYILRHANQPRFKIGKANDIINRARSFGWSSVDFSNSLGLSVESEADAHILERILHRSFRRFSLKPEVVVSTGGAADGASEWFDICCLPRLRRYLEENSDLYPHTLISGELLEESIRKSAQPTEAALLRAKKKEEKEARRLQRLETDRLSRIEQMEILKNTLEAARKKFNEELSHHNSEERIAGISHGKFDSRLILIDMKSTQPKKSIWRLDLRDTQYSWRYGGGSIVSAISQISLPNAQISAVSIPCLSRSEEFSSVEGVIQKIFKSELAWLKLLPEIPNSTIDSIFPLGFLSRDEHERQLEEKAALKLIEDYKLSTLIMPRLLE